MQQDHLDVKTKYISQILNETDSMRMQRENQAEIPFHSFIAMH